MKSKINLIQISILLFILQSSLCLKVEINNIHNGYKYIFKGTPVLSIQQSPPSTLTLTNTQTLLDTLPKEQSLKPLLQISGSLHGIDLKQLVQVNQLYEDDYTDVIMTNWSEKSHYTVIITLMQQDILRDTEINKKQKHNNHRLYQRIFQNTKPIMQQDL